MQQGINQDKASLNLLNNVFEMNLVPWGTPVIGEPSQKTPLVAGGDSPVPSQSTAETMNLKGKRISLTSMKGRTSRAPMTQFNSP